MRAGEWLCADPKSVGGREAGFRDVAGAQTIASGLRVPKAYADYVILDILKKSNGTAVTVTDDEMMDALFEWAGDEGVFAAPEGAASLFAYRKLRARGFLKETDTVVLFNTGSGYKYIDVIAEYMGNKSASANNGMARPKARQVGGIITLLLLSYDKTALLRRHISARI